MPPAAKRKPANSKDLYRWSISFPTDFGSALIDMSVRAGMNVATLVRSMVMQIPEVITEVEKTKKKGASRG